LTLDEGKLSSSRFDCFTPLKEAKHPLNEELSGPSDELDGLSNMALEYVERCVPKMSVFQALLRLYEDA